MIVRKIDTCCIEKVYPVHAVDCINDNE